MTSAADSHSQPDLSAPPTRALRICFLSSMHTPTDKRVFQKEARTLAAAGFTVVHLAPGEEPSRTADGVHLQVYQGRVGLWGRVRSFYGLYRRAAATNADVYHCNEVDSWIVGLLLKGLRQSRVIFDVHEHYPSTFAGLHCPKWLSPVAEWLIRTTFRILTPWTDYFVFAKRSVAADFPDAEDRSIVVLNCAPLEGESEENGGKTCSNSRPITAIHIGVFGRERGWPQLLDAMTLSQTPALRIKFIGTCTDKWTEDLRRAAQIAGLSDRVEILEWMPYVDVCRHLAAADIGLVLFQPGIQNHVFAMPHKMFDYMKARLPVIVPDFAVEIAPIVREEECGVLVDSSSAHAVAKALDTLAADPTLRARYGENGRRAVFRRYNWEKEAEALVALYRRIQGSPGPGR